MAEFDRSELLKYFISEAEDHINTLDKGIPELESAPDNGTLIEDLYRTAHTLKGAAALLKLKATSNIAHRMEDILENLKDGRSRPGSAVVELLSYILDNIKGLIQDIVEGRGENAEVEQQVIQRIDEVMAGEKVEAATPDEVIKEVPAAPEPGVSAAPEKRDAVGRRKEDFEFFSGNFVKVDVQKVEEMLNLIGEITIKKNYLLQRSKETGEISDEIFLQGGNCLKRSVTLLKDTPTLCPPYREA